ncbi:MAG: hypothetical protein AABZ47_09100, partial [Planctomycetota bacterium]
FFSAFPLSKTRFDPKNQLSVGQLPFPIKTLVTHYPQTTYEQKKLCPNSLFFHSKSAHLGVEAI